MDNELTTSFGKLSSGVSPLGLKERMKLLHDFYRIGEESDFHFDLTTLMKRGHDFKDLICPDSIEFKGDHFKMGEKYGRVLFLKEYAAFLKDDMISDLTNVPINLMLSVDILPIPTDEAVKDMQKKLLAVEADIARWQRRQNSANNFNAIIPYELEQMRNEVKEFLDDLTSRDQRMMFGLVTLVHLADSLEELNADTENFIAIARKRICYFSILKEQQEDGLNTVLPLGLRCIDTTRTLTTESVGALIPFHSQEVFDVGGQYYGQSAVSRNLIICDRTKLLNPHTWILGVSGSGKSLMAKFLIAELILSTEDDVIVLDIENEYSALIQTMGGVVADISAASKNHINALDINQDYGGEDDPVAVKSEFVLSLCQQIMKSKELDATEKSLIDRCTRLVYDNYELDYSGQPPTFLDFYDVLLQQPEELSRDIALALELFTKGSLNVFAKPTNIQMSSRIMCFNLYKLGKSLMDVGMLVCLDHIFNRVSANRASGRRTHIFIDEMHIYFQNEYSGQFFSSAWKRYRKYNAYLTGLTQNITEVLHSKLASTMLSNSEFLILLNQAAQDQKRLADLLSISETQLSYISNAKAGHGLMKVGGNLIPFENEIPTNTELYKLISTKPGE